MDILLNHLWLGLAVASQPQNLAMAFLGVVVGTLIGVLPGIGPLATMAMLLPMTFYVPPETAIIMLAGIYYGAQYGGSTTAILVNMPGESSSAVTCIDGYQMAKNGRAGAALAVAAVGSFVGGTISLILIILFAVPLSTLALAFSPADYFSLMVFGLVGSTFLAHGSPIKGIGMILMGILLGSIGTDVNSSTLRFTFGLNHLYDGLDFASVAVGMFGIAEILRNVADGQGARSMIVEKVTNLWPTRTEIRASVGPVLRGGMLGSILGILPGGGALLSSFASYAVEKKLSKTPEKFGRGAVEGVAGPETANNAGAQTSFIPMLTLGLPSNVVMALMIGALMIHGIVPGPQIMTEHPALVWALIVSMWIGNLILIIINLPLIRLWVALLRVRYTILFPCVILLCSVGAYSLNNSEFDVYVTAAFGLLGYILVRLGCEPAPFALGFVLGGPMEVNFRRAMQLSRGDPMTFIEHPISLVFLIAVVIAVIIIILPAVRKKREVIFTAD